jgi:hypothetical protein
MAKFRKKPVVVEAEQFWPWAMPHPRGVGVKSVDGRPDSVEGQKIEWYVNTAGGPADVFPGDWIITEPDSRGHYPCRPDIFTATYEPAE